MTVALISVPGYGHSLLPGALSTLSEALHSQGVSVTCHFLCAEYSDLLLRKHPDLVAIDYKVAQWANSYHEAFFHDLMNEPRMAKRAGSKPPDGFAPSVSIELIRTSFL